MIRPAIHPLARPDSLERQPGEPVQPPLRLLERPAPRRPTSPLQTAEPAQHWLDRLRHVAWRALAQ